MVMGEEDERTEKRKKERILTRSDGSVPVFCRYMDSEVMRLMGRKNCSRGDSSFYGILSLFLGVFFPVRLFVRPWVPVSLRI